jgi:hypothetical protein
LAADVDKILGRVWIYGFGDLMVKRWAHLFNSETDHFRFRHIWVLLPSCPLAFWNFDAFKAIGDALGKFFHVDSKVHSGKDRKVGRILVELDLHNGLSTELENEWLG